MLKLHVRELINDRYDYTIKFWGENLEEWDFISLNYPIGSPRKVKGRKKSIFDNQPTIPPDFDEKLKEFERKAREMFPFREEYID